MPTIDVVSDANVALKWFHSDGEEEVDSARALLDLHGKRVIALHVLDLTRYEIGNALLRGRLRVAADRVTVVLDALAEVCPQIVPAPNDLRDAIALAEHHDLTVYDALYASVARARGARLATLDRALLERDLGDRPSTILGGLSRQTLAPGVDEPT